MALLVGLLGAVLVSNHLLSHYVEALPPQLRAFVPSEIAPFARAWGVFGAAHIAEDNVIPGMLLLAFATGLDWWVDRSPRGACAAPDYWKMVLLGSHGGLRRGRHLLGLIPHGPRCKLCNAPFGGVGALLMRVINKRPSSHNPRFCEDCLVKTPVGGAEVELSLLFADVRGSTALAEHGTVADFAALMNRFFRVGTDALVRSDALIERFQGDAVIGLFVPGFAGPKHAQRALEAAAEILHAVGYGRPSDPWIPVGIGVHTGTAYVGTVGFGGALGDLTVLGDAANTAARLAARAGPGEILVSEAAATAAGFDSDGVEQRHLTLKGRTAPVTSRVITLG